MHHNGNPENMLDQYGMQQGQYQQYPPQQFQQKMVQGQYQQYPPHMQQQHQMYEMNHDTNGLMGHVPYRGNQSIGHQHGNANGLVNLGRLGEEMPQQQGDGSELFTFSELRLDR
jgi:hypothetical protein